MSSTTPLCLLAYCSLVSRQALLGTVDASFRWICARGPSATCAPAARSPASRPTPYQMIQRGRWWTAIPKPEAFRGGPRSLIRIKSYNAGGLRPRSRGLSRLASRRASRPHPYQIIPRGRCVTAIPRPLEAGLEASSVSNNTMRAISRGLSRPDPYQIIPGGRCGTAYPGPLEALSRPASRRASKPDPYQKPQCGRFRSRLEALGVFGLYNIN